jgi:NIPSNAP
MYGITRRPYLVMAIVLAAFAVAALRMTQADNSEPAPNSVKGEVPAVDRAPQMFELRVYTAAAGKMEALDKRFRDHTLRLFEKHGIKSVGYWTAVDEKHQGRLYYIIAYPDRESREKMLVNGVAKDAEFLKAVAESEKEGKPTVDIESVLMVPTDYSPMK